MKRLIFGMMFAVLTHPAHAGNLSAYACGEFAVGKPLDVQVDNDSAQMEKIRTTVINALRDRKTAVSDDAPWVLAIRTEAIREGVRRKGRDLGTVRDGSSENVNVRMNVWSNRKDSIIGGRKTDVIAGPVDEVWVTISINDKASGKCIWRGEARHDSIGQDQWEISEKVSLVLIGAMGEATRDRSFEVG
jgi:hypothetical protein